MASTSSPPYPPLPSIISTLPPCNILITGASGFIGSYLTRLLYSLGHTIYILCRESSDLNTLKDIKFSKCIGDITDRRAVSEACQNIDTVFHLAAYIGYTVAERKRMESINIDGTENILKACMERKVRRLVYCSSIVAIGANKSKEDKLLNEESIYNMNDLNLGYYQTKYKAEQLVKKYIKDSNLNAVILNLSNVYGYGDALKSSRSTQIKAAQGKLPFYTYGGINVVSINDVIVSFVNAWEKAPAGSSYIIGGENITVYKMLSLFAEFGHVKPPYIPIPNYLLMFAANLGIAPYEKVVSSQMFHWYDNSKVVKELGLKPTSARECIRESVRFMKDGGIIRKKKTSIFSYLNFIALLFLGGVVYMVIKRLNNIK